MQKYCTCQKVGYMSTQWASAPSFRRACLLRWFLDVTRSSRFESTTSLSAGAPESRPCSATAARHVLAWVRSFSADVQLYSRDGVLGDIYGYVRCTTMAFGFLLYTAELFVIICRHGFMRWWLLSHLHEPVCGGCLVEALSSWVMQQPTLQNFWCSYTAKPQRIQNVAVRLVIGARRADHITPVLYSVYIGCRFVRELHSKSLTWFTK